MKLSIIDYDLFKSNFVSAISLESLSPVYYNTLIIHLLNTHASTHHIYIIFLHNGTLFNVSHCIVKQ